ncbi:MAG: hypothetical protein GC136_03635 [Alphaproteobacteria bacterium]|nr:hypothetical protein [Alphaproteobacteria bacterium]
MLQVERDKLAKIFEQSEGETVTFGVRIKNAAQRPPLHIETFLYTLMEDLTNNTLAHIEIDTLRGKNEIVAKTSHGAFFLIMSNEHCQSILDMHGAEIFDAHADSKLHALRRKYPDPAGFRKLNAPADILPFERPFPKF